MPQNEVKSRITCIEDLSNELLYEIFDYLYGWCIYKAFYKLNYRFRHLILHSSYPLKIDFPLSPQSELEHYSNHFIIPNRSHVLSICFEKQSPIHGLFRHCMVNSSFDRLESFITNGITFDQFELLLVYLNSLPRLFSLVVHVYYHWRCDLGRLYQLILLLPVLKYNKLTCDIDTFNENMNISVPFPTNEQFSTIEHLDIEHSCTTEQLFTILHHTPQLRRLSFGNGCLMESNMSKATNNPVELSRLTHLHISDCRLTSDQFEKFIMNICSQLQVLHVQQCTFAEYLDADRWERLITNQISHLRKFDYVCRKCYFDEFMEANPFLKINQFISPFWTERQWFFEIIVDDDDMTISIHSHKKRWFNEYEYEQGSTGTCLNQSMECTIISKQENIDKSSTKLDRTIQSNLNLILSQVDQMFIEEFNAVCDAIPFTHLNIECDEISNEILLNIVQLLPNLESLKVSSKRINEIDRSFTIVKSMYFLTTTNNKITKVYLAKTIYLTQVNFLLNLCLSMQHFQVDVPEDMNLGRLVQFILFKVTTIIPKLRSLCLCIPKAGEHTIRQIRNRIESKNLLSNYRITHSGDNILVTWI